MLKLIIITFLLFTIIDGFRWASSNYANYSKSVISLKLSVTGPKIDVYAGEQITIIKNIPSYNSPITIYCFISGYNMINDITFSFCKDGTCSINVKDGESFNKNSMYKLEYVEISSKFPNQKGIKVEFKISNDLIDSSGDYYCKAADAGDKFSIRSNNIQIRDVIYWAQNYVLNNENIKIFMEKNIPRNELPVEFKCSQGSLNLNKFTPSWISQEFPNPVSWVLCPVKNNFVEIAAKDRLTYHKCIHFTTTKWTETDQTLRPKELREITKWNYFVDVKGTLNIFSIDKDSELINSKLSYVLMCYAKNQNSIKPISTYLKEEKDGYIVSGITFDDKENDNRRLFAISEKHRMIQIYTRKKEKDDNFPPISIFCLYNSSSNIQTDWYHNELKLSNGAFLTVDPYKVNFLGNITSEDAGTYILKVIQNDSDQLTMRIDVEVLGPPTVLDTCLPRIRHVWEHEGTDLMCTYGGSPNVTEIYINAQNIPLKNSVWESQTQIKKQYTYLILLNFTANVKILNPNKTYAIIYSVYGLTKTQGQTFYQDHTVTFLAKNDFGMVVKSTSIYTVPRLKDHLLISPELSNCTTSCSSAEKHQFQCRIDTSVYNNKELTIEHYWTIDGHRLEQNWLEDNKYAQYFIVDPQTKDLTLLPIASNNTERDKFVKAALKKNFIYCNFDLRSTSDSSPIFIYNSYDDKSLSDRLKARITIDYQPINTAYIYWVVSLILVLLIIFIVIVLLTRYCLRNKGETYQLDKIERKHGYDPEKEVQDEMFKPYEREEHDGDVMSTSINARKLSLSENSVGSVDDGELDSYDLDPTDFNEDGSIIDKYGANPRSRVVMA